MFIYLKHSEAAKRSRMEIRKISEQNGYYFEIEFFGKLMKKSIAKGIRKCGDFRIISSGIPIPPRYKNRIINTEKFDKILLLNSFCETVRGSKQALIIDPAGELCDMIARPLSAVGRLYILTDSAELYAAPAKKALCEIGAAPIFPDSAILSPMPTLSLSPYPPPFTLLFGEGGFTPTEDTVFIKKSALPYALAAAKYEVFAEKIYENAMPQKIKNETICCTPKDLKKMLDTTYGATYN